MYIFRYLEMAGFLFVFRFMSPPVSCNWSFTYRYFTTIKNFDVFNDSLVLELFDCARFCLENIKAASCRTRIAAGSSCMSLKTHRFRLIHFYHNWEFTKFTLFQLSWNVLIDFKVISGDACCIEHLSCLHVNQIRCTSKSIWNHMVF